MIYQVGKKQCSISGRKQNDIAPLESDFMVQPPSLLEFPGPLTPQPPWNFQFPPWWGSGYFLEPHNVKFHLDGLKSVFKVFMREQSLGAPDHLHHCLYRVLREVQCLQGKALPWCWCRN